MDRAIYVLCGLASIACAVLLIKGYRRTRTQLLFWCAVFFISQAVNNVFLYIDLVIFPPEIDLHIVRNLIVLPGVLALIFGFVRESK